MFLVFDVDDTMYDLMWPFQMAFENILAEKTTVSCEELFRQSRICSDIVLEKEKQGLILPEEAFFRRMQMTCEMNGSRKSQGRKLEVLQLERWFDDENVFISGEVGYHKPDVRVFQHVQEKMAIQCEDAWYIGDTYENDIVGAHQAGWHSIWLNHRNRPCPDVRSLADIELKNKEELLPTIQRLSRKAD